MSRWLLRLYQLGRGVDIDRADDDRRNDWIIEPFVVIDMRTAQRRYWKPPVVIEAKSLLEFGGGLPRLRPRARIQRIKMLGFPLKRPAQLFRLRSRLIHYGPAVDDVDQPPRQCFACVFPYKGSRGKPDRDRRGFAKTRRNIECGRNITAQEMLAE